MKRLLALAFVLGVATTASAQTPEVVLTSQYKSVYLGPDGALFHSNPILESTIDLGWKSGIWVEVWSSTGYESRKNYGKEADLLAGLERRFGPVVIAIDGAYFAVLGQDILNGNAKLRIGPDFLGVFAKIEEFHPTRGNIGAGRLTSVGLEHQFVRPHVEVFLDGSYKRDSGAFGLNRADLWFAGGELRLGSEKTKVVVSGRYSQPITIVTDGRKEQLVWGFGLSHKF